MVKVNVLNPTGVDIQTNAERDAGHVDVGFEKNIEVDIKPTTGVKINDSKKTEKEKLNFKRAINGDIMIFEHKDIDIMILRKEKKVVAFAKEILTDNVYGAESRLFDHLRKRGIIKYDSVQGGNIYGSMEGKMLEPVKEIKNLSSLTLTIIHEWLKSEKPMMDYMEQHDDLMDDAILDPDDDKATELGEVPHEEEKGSILQKNLFAPYLYGRYTY
jgi:hypothetical protein